MVPTDTEHPDTKDHQLLALWAADCAECALPLFQNGDRKTIGRPRGFRAPAGLEGLRLTRSRWMRSPDRCPFRVRRTDLEEPVLGFGLLQHRSFGGLRWGRPQRPPESDHWQGLVMAMHRKPWIGLGIGGRVMLQWRTRSMS